MDPPAQYLFMLHPGPILDAFQGRRSWDCLGRTYVQVRLRGTPEIGTGQHRRHSSFLSFYSRKSGVDPPAQYLFMLHPGPLLDAFQGRRSWDCLGRTYLGNAQVRLRGTAEIGTGPHRSYSSFLSFYSRKSGVDPLAQYLFMYACPLCSRPASPASLQRNTREGERDRER